MTCYDARTMLLRGHSLLSLGWPEEHTLVLGKVLGDFLVAFSRNNLDPWLLPSEHSAS